MAAKSEYIQACVFLGSLRSRARTIPRPILSRTKQGILALNVGIIDPFFPGPISTALINFSDRARRIDLGDKFFRIAFLDHADVTAYHNPDENTERASYVRQLQEASYADFSPSFLNIPSFDDDYYTKKFWSVLWRGITNNKTVSIPLLIFIFVVGWFLVHLGFIDFLADRWIKVGEIVKRYKWW